MDKIDDGHSEVRAAELSIERQPEEGVTMTIKAGKLRLRFYIDGQWSDLVRQIQAGEGQLQDLVPFKMKPIPVSALRIEDEERKDIDPEIISSRTLQAYPIPGLSRDAPEFKTPLWKGALPSLQVESDDLE